MDTSLGYSDNIHAVTLWAALKVAGRWESRLENMCREGAMKFTGNGFVLYT